MYLCAKSLLCDPMDCYLPDSTVHGILQLRILGWVAMLSSRGSSQPKDRTQVSCIAGRFFYHLSHQGSPRILEWVDHPFSRGSSWIRNQTGVSCTAVWFFSSWLSAYLRLLVSLPTVLIPACDSSSPAFHMMYSAYKLYKQGDKIEPGSLLFQFGTSLFFHIWF